MRVSITTIGPYFWELIHCYALVFPIEPTENDRNKAIQFYSAIPNWLGCPICVNHFKELLEQAPPDVTDRASLVTWTWQVHNHVNERIGKPHFNKDDFVNRFLCRVDEAFQPIPNYVSFMTGNTAYAMFHSFV